MHGRFRLDINGLRAVAVLAVILFHSKVWPVVGGFVGVDVFFVISGFLMTQIIAGGLQRGEFKLLRFYGQRLARIVPALAVVAAAPLALGWAVLLPDQLVRLAKEAAYSLLFLVNVHYAADTGYFSPAAAQSWFLHCWSLAVEFQFYIVFPLVLLVARKIAGRNGMIGAIVLLAALSAAWIWWETPRYQPNAFYLMPARFWEFALGGLVVFLPPPARWNSVVTVGGLGLIVWAVLTYREGLHYPGLWPFIPVLGAAAVIYAGAPTPVLANPVAQYLGAISYSLYLWHWPILLTARYFGWSDGVQGVVGMLAATLLTASLSYRFVETPARLWLRRPSLPRIAIPTAAVAALVAFSVLVVRDKGRRSVSPRRWAA